ncbi:MAG: tRNA preQ1(34) S-adenosylmethionine ribosyltransferase-isomerase QueA [Elusimicrobiota bacterium]|nr:tRNA preQ1(34) S-adenosylmethionine ribosyltransferase-isomerase QueA [Elusimicrobiota bacterium]
MKINFNMTDELKISDFDYDLPKEFIAKFPSVQRDGSKLLVIHRDTGKIEHKIFRDIVDYFSEGDVLVINKTKVIPARLVGYKETGGKIEILILGYGDSKAVPAIVKPLKNLKIGSRIFIQNEFPKQVRDKFCEVVSIENEIVKLKFSDEIDTILKKYGKIPLPPYIKRDIIPSDVERYQTVFASALGSVAAPTAGLHFTENVLSQLRNNGVKIADVLLHISWATFSPVRCENITEHKMGEEYFEIEKSSADIINSAKRKIAVGTTSVRVLETSLTSDSKKVTPKKGATDIFIYPGYKFKNVDALLTNFHLPQTTLLMLVCAFAGRDLIFKAYEEAKKNNYRFASYGDAMLVL